MTAERWLLDWVDAADAGIETCGGKGWNLARLERYGFAVPDGGVVAAAAYRAVLDGCLEPEEADRLRQLDAESVLTPEAERRLEALRRRILAAPLPDGMEAALQRFLAPRGLADAPLAVRSSAVGEDGDRHSFAGIHGSVLNVRGLPALLDAVRRCYASLWTPRAVAYRRHAEIDDQRCACAVVICRMVSAEGRDAPAAAGVLFTCDPLSGRRDRLVINAVAGLADRLVSGAVEPEQIVVDSHLLDYGVVQRKRPADTPPPPLPDAAVTTLARWGMRAHWAFGDGDRPQDLEWAYDGERLWLLQTRPVTRLPHRTFDALVHLPVLWSNANLKEVVGGVPTTLSWSVIQDAVRDMLLAPARRAGFAVPGGMALLRRIEGRAYFDLGALQWTYYDGFGYPPAQLNHDLGGNQPEIPLPAGDPMRGAAGRRRAANQRRMIGALWGIGKRLDRAHDEALARVRAFRGQPLDGLDEAALSALLREWAEFGIEVARLFQFANSDAGLWLRFSRELIARVRHGEGDGLLGKLLAAGGGMPSAEALHRLHRLATVAAADPSARAWFETPGDWRALAGPFRDALDDYLARFGHRAVDETELAAPRWSEAPDYLLGEVARLLGHPAEGAAASARARRAEGERELKRLPWWSRPALRWLAARTRRGMVHREIGKSLTIATFEPVRRIALEIGRRLTVRGCLARPEQVFQLAFADLDALLSGSWDGRGAAALADDRERQRAAWRALDGLDVVIEGDPASLVARAAEPPLEGGEGWRGNGVSPGAAEGIARVLRRPEEGTRLRPGEILVAATTDPGWTPLFLRAGGVVTEIGGYLSHGAIVARELGLPAVVNLRDARKHLAGEPEVRIDGAAGAVYPLRSE